MMLMMIGTIVWTDLFDTLKPNPGLTGHPVAQTYEIPSATAPGGNLTMTVPAVAGLPVDQHLGNLEGKELRFGTSACATYAAVTVDVTTGSINCEMDSLNPIAALSPMTGMWLNVIFGGKGVGMINMLMYVIIGIFIVGMMVGRSPEYLGKKIGGREVKLAVIALLLHPFLILFPTGLFAATSWGIKAASNPGAAWFFANGVPVLLRLGQQRLGLRRAGDGLRFRQQSESRARGHSLGHRGRPGDAFRPLSADPRDDGHGRLSGRQESRAVRPGNLAG